MSTFTLTADEKQALKEAGVESFHGPHVRFPDELVCEAPCSIKWMAMEHSVHMGAFSYAVNGYYFGSRIGRYTSIGESVQVGRQDHHTDWLSTSPFQYLNTKLFDVGMGFEGGDKFHEYRSHLLNKVPGMQPKITHIGHDVWIGHGSFVKAGVTIGHGAIVAAHSVVVKDVPPYAVVAGNPAVVKKYRIPERFIEPMLELSWWDYAPWQLNSISFNNIESAIDQLRQLRESDEPTYQPGTLRVKDLVQAQ